MITTTLQIPELLATWWDALLALTEANGSGEGMIDLFTDDFPEAPGFEVTLTLTDHADGPRIVPELIFEGVPVAALATRRVLFGVYSFEYSGETYELTCQAGDENLA